MIVFLLLAASAASDPPHSCPLTSADYEANSRLGFDAFDQAGALPSSARKLGERGCWKEAAAATADYLIRGPVPTPGQQRILLFHLGQQLALSGDERTAASFIAATRAPSGASSSDLDWNDYVVGTWAFLTKDRPLLVKSRDAVLASPGEGNRINGGLLAAMERCFEKSYLAAYNSKCGL